SSSSTNLCGLSISLSILQQSCSQNIAFHFVLSTSAASLLHSTIFTSFPYLNFQFYFFDDFAIVGLISTSIVPALEASTTPSTMPAII
ncbi:hypothetical protein U1Q18_013681, partial [Sarracenia purpurea var. burkii]